MTTRKKTYHSQSELKAMALNCSADVQKEKLRALFDAPAMNWEVVEVVHNANGLCGVFVQASGVFALVSPTGKLSRAAKGRKTIKYNLRTLEHS